MNAPSLEFADFSRNTLLSLPDDLFEQFASLKLLRLAGNLLQVVPPAVCLLQSLTHLDLSKNRLKGPELAPLARCTRLTHLYLAGNSITMLPSELSQLERLHLIDLSNNYLEQVPPVLFTISTLRELDLSFNRLRELPDEICSLSNLMALVCVGNLISRVSPQVATLPGLRFIDVRGSAVDNLDTSFRLPIISEVHAAYSGMRRVEVNQETTLTQLVAHHNLISEVQVTALMAHLRVLNLAVCRLLILPESLFEYMPKLEELILDRNKLQSLPSSISHLHRLHHLSASDNAIDTFPRLAFAECQRLRSINLRGNNINEFPVGLWSLPALEHLNLSSNFISAIPAPPSAEAPPPLARSLLELYIAENKLKGEQIDRLGCLANLEVLNVSFNEVYELADCLFNLCHLRELYASAAFLAQLNERIEQLPNLKILMLNGNNFTNVPGELCKVTALSVLDLSSNNLRYNVLNHPYDWNWNFNPNLQYLNLSNNRRLDISPKPSTGKAASSSNEPDLTEFSSLQRLRLLDYANVGSTLRHFKPSVSLRIRDAPPAGSLRMAVGEFCGRRVIFDQVDLVIPNYLDHENDHLLGLFDGCGDEFVPIFVRERLPAHLREELSRLQPDESYGEAIRRAFLQTGHELSEQPIQGDNGAVGTLLYLLGNELYVANVGNTMAIMSREGNPVILTAKHHAWSREEIDRIRSLGGFIAPCGRVERELAITRAFGYHHLLPFVNAEPSIRRMEITRLDEFIILASASVWKFIRYQMAIDIVRGERGDLDFAVKRLRDTALAYGATESMTIIVLDLRNLQRGSLPDTEALQIDGHRRRRVFRSDTEDQSLARLEAEPDPPMPPFCMVFTDIRESSPLWQHNPNAMFAANKIHHELMRRSARNYGGYEIKSEGDSLFVVFQTVSAAIRWCQAVQLQLLQADWPVEILEHELCAPVHGEQGELLYRGLWVRMGVHFGDPLPDRDKQHSRTDFQGPDVIRCARIMNNALGGEILLTTDAYRSLQADPAFQTDGIEMEFYSIGPMTLKGLLPDANPIYSAYPKQLAGRFRSRLARMEEEAEKGKTSK